MLHKTLQTKATTTTDRGEFQALAACYTVDRIQDKIVPGAFAKTIAAWQASGKRLPLHYDHKGDPEYIIGSVDPAKMKEVDEGLYIEGNIDLEGSEIGREAWRVMKDNAMSLSFGYLETKTKKRKDGGKDLLEVDVFEFTVTPAPMHPDTRFLSLKSDAQLEEEAPDDARALRRQHFEHELETALNAPVKRRAGGTMPEGLTPNVLKAAEKVLAFLEQNPKLVDQADVLFKRAAEMHENESEMAISLAATWTPAYINDLPDSAFLHVESGGKNKDGKTKPRSLRHFPYRDADGAVDLLHLRNALSRLPQSNLSQDVKDSVTEKAQRILDNTSKALQQVEEGRDEEPETVKSAPQDPLRKRTNELVLDIASDGLSRRRYVESESKPEPAEPLDERELRRQTDVLRLEIVSG